MERVGAVTVPQLSLSYESRGARGGAALSDRVLNKTVLAILNHVFHFYPQRGAKRVTTQSSVR